MLNQNYLKEFVDQGTLMAKILITGTAGFIGFHLKKMLERGDDVIGLDSINDYYDVRVKHGRLAVKGIINENIQYDKLVQSNRYKICFVQLNEDAEALHLSGQEQFDTVINLAAQAGFRYSLKNLKPT